MYQPVAPAGIRLTGMNCAKRAAAEFAIVEKILDRDAL